MSDGVSFTVRDGSDDDRPFIAKSWLETLRASHEARAVDSSTFSKHHLGAISRVLERGAVTVRVATPLDDSFTIYGFGVFQPPQKVHLVYTRKAMRRMGIARALLSGMNLTEAIFSTWSPDVQHWIFEKYKGLHYEPIWAEAYHGRSETSAAVR